MTYEASWYTGSKHLIRSGAIYKGNSEARG